ncbi:MAG: hypothetical protein ACK501_18530 [Planctomycetota bacterium]|jgi:hypothetical protein
MRLDPVLLAAPNAPPALMPTRRAFVLGGAMFTTGLSLGGACGYAIGSRRAEPAAEVEESSGDADLDELRRLAVKAPIEELVKHDLLFITMTTRTYRRDQILWRGMVRLADRVLADASYPNRRSVARVLVQCFQRVEPGLTDYSSDKLLELSKVK